MQTLEKLFFAGYDLTQGADFYILYGFCLTTRENSLCVDYLTESSGNPFISLNIRLTDKQASEIENGLQDTPAFIRSNFSEQQQNEILTLGYEFANELGIDLEREYRKMQQVQAIFTALPDCNVYECFPDYAPLGDYLKPFIYLNEQDEYIFIRLARIGLFSFLPDFTLNLETGKEEGVNKPDFLTL
jgi:hypothetical protein